MLRIVKLSTVKSVLPIDSCKCVYFDSPHDLDIIVHVQHVIFTYLALNRFDDFLMRTIVVCVMVIVGDYYTMHFYIFRTLGFREANHDGNVLNFFPSVYIV